MSERTLQIPPIKIQGIKSKLVPWIRDYAGVEADTLWVEPFMGSGVVGFNIANVNRFALSDNNPYLIQFYQSIQERKITSAFVRGFLEDEGQKLEEKGADHYYTIRERFNASHDSLDFLFLNRSCFNGLMRFNKNGGFNVPFCRKPQRFSKSYITKIVNQVKYIEELFRYKDFQFVCRDFRDTISAMDDEDVFFYCDPPYIGRYADYFDAWDDISEYELHRHLVQSGKRFMLSTWHHNRYRDNPFIHDLWGDCTCVQIKHFYHVGAREDNRNEMTEALLMNYDINQVGTGPTKENIQESLFSLV